MQKAILKFRDYLGNDLISGISNGQNVTSHANLNGANDFNGRGANDRVDLLAPYDCVVKAISRADNTVLFESLDMVETPAGYNYCWFLCTHMLDKDWDLLGIKIDKVFKQGEPCYTEGTKSAYNVDIGNHIHMEQGIGRHNGNASPYYKSNDTYTYEGKVYNTYYPNIDGYECPITDMFFLPDGVEVVQGSSTVAKGYKWKTTSDSGEPDQPNNSVAFEFVDGYQELNFNGTKVHAYKLKPGQKLGLMSAVVDNKSNNMAVKTIDKIDNDKIHYCKISGNRFVMTTGEHIGVEQSFENDFAPKQKEFISLWHAKDDTFGYCDADNYWDTKDNVYFACSPDAVLMKDGQVVKYVAKGVESSRLTVKTQQSLLIVLKDGNKVLAVTEAISLNSIVDILKDSVRDIYAFDGGGSAQMIVNGLKKQYTGRAISCVLTAYTDPGQIDEPTPDPDPTPDTGVPDEEYEALYTALKKEYEDLQVENGTLKKQIDEMAAKIETLNAVNDDLELKVDQAIQILEGE